ncbi:MAG: class I SAM-dependent methyltransferase [Dehalococcoidia bacterium]
MTQRIKRFYADHWDRIIDKRYNSLYWIRRYAHRQIYAQFLPYLRAGQRVLDAGCGEGALSCLVARQGIEVVGADISAPNVEAARRLAAERGMGVRFVCADLENLPFGDNSFDIVISSHVLEHLPDLSRGLGELYRVTRSMALIAMPTCLNPSAWALLGGDNYWVFSKRSTYALALGMLRTLYALVGGQEGPNEHYAGRQELPHLWRFPWVMRRHIETVGFRIVHFEAGPLIIPYVPQYLPLLRPFQRIVDQWRHLPLLKYLGYGSLVVCCKGSAVVMD